MALTTAQKVKVRYHLGYPMFGGSPVQAFSYRYMTHYGDLEFRLSNMLADEEAFVVAAITTLDSLETAIDGSGANADTAAAAVWTRNPAELAERKALYMDKRQRLARFLGVPLNDEPDNSLQLVV